MRRWRALAAAAIALWLPAAGAAAQVIKLGTLAPAGSPWEVGLRKLAAEWSRLSGGTVDLRIYPGGILGDEDDMLRLIRIGELNAAALSGPGLSSIVPAVLTLQLPRLVSDDAELDALMAKMSPVFDRQFEARGFKLLEWTRAGWAYIFSRDPVIRPDDLKREKLWVWDGLPDEVKAWTALGFQTVTLASPDIMVQLQSGGIDAFITSPVVAASNQYFAVADNMTDLPWAPFVGGLVVSLRTWSAIPADLRRRLEQAAADVTEGYRTQIRKSDNDAIAVMKKYGLVVNEVPADAQEAWKRFFTRGVDAFIGNNVDRSYYETASRYLDELRRAGPDR